MYQALKDALKHAGRLSALAWLTFGVLIPQAVSPPEAAAAELPDAITLGIRLEQGDLATVRAWLAAGLDPNTESDRIGTGLMIAAWHGNIPLMELLVRHGADVNRVNGFKEQALMHAAWKGQREAVVWLLEHGASVNRDGNEWSALHYAAFEGHAEIARLLMQKGADINAKSTNGSTVLMIAAYAGRERIAELLLAAGADRAIKNDRDDNALSWAMRYGHLTIAKMIATADEFAKAAARAKENRSEAVVPIPLPAPVEVENMLQAQRLAHADGKQRVLTDEDYRKVLARVATMRPAAPVARQPKRLHITARRGDPSQEQAELQFGK